MHVRDVGNVLRLSKQASFSSYFTNMLEYFVSAPSTVATIYANDLESCHGPYYLEDESTLDQETYYSLE